MKFKSGARLFQSLNLNKFNVPLKYSLQTTRIIKKERYFHSIYYDKIKL